MGMFPEITAEEDWAPILIQTALYGYVLFNAANLIGDGAELLLLCPAFASVVGSIVIPILGAVPDGMMVFCSGLGSKEHAQEQVSVGVGALAGSTIMLLTVPWFLSIWAGRVTIKDGKPTYKKPAGASENWEKLDPNASTSLTKTGVGIGATIPKNAKLMLATLTSYLVIQIPAMLVDPKDPYARHSAPLPTDGDASKMQWNKIQKTEQDFEYPFGWAGLVCSIGWFVFYLWKMVTAADDGDSAVADKIVAKTVAGIQNGQLSLRGAIAEFRDNTWDTLCATGSLDQALLPGSKALGHVEQMCKVLVPFYATYDTSKDGMISYLEFQMLIKDLHENLEPDVQKKIFDAADTDKSGDINFEEFVACIISFAMDPTDTLKDDEAQGLRRVATKSMYLPQKDGGDEPGDDEEGPEEEDMPEDLAGLSPEEQQARIKKRAFTNMSIGTALVLIFSDPMCDMLGVMADKAKIDKFIVSFVLAPLASNASELVAAMKLASKKTQSSMVNSLSSLEGAAIMNNTFCLAIFFVLIVWKGLVWEFTAETAAIVAIEVLVAIIALTCKTETLMHGLLILAFYPFSLVIVKGLEAVGFD